LRVPLDVRRSEIERISWVESAQRAAHPAESPARRADGSALPSPFARNGNQLALIDAHGVILDRPQGEDIRFPIVTGVSEEVPIDQREKRMQTYEEFIKVSNLVRASSSDHVSESTSPIPRISRGVTGLASANDAQAVTIHFGSGELPANTKAGRQFFAQWQANAGRVQSIDLQLQPVVVNPEPARHGHGKEKIDLSRERRLGEER